MEVDVNYLLQTIGALHVKQARLEQENQRLRAQMTKQVSMTISEDEVRPVQAADTWPIHAVQVRSLPSSPRRSSDCLIWHIWSGGGFAKSTVYTRYTRSAVAVIDYLSSD